MWRRRISVVRGRSTRACWGCRPEETQEEAGVVFYRLAGVPLMVYQTDYAGTAKNTVFAIDTDDLAEAMSALREKGVVFMDYDFPGLKTVDGVAEHGWRESRRGSRTARGTSSRSVRAT